jgi:SOS response regulatory protein OraA/RecX
MKVSAEKYLFSEAVKYLGKYPATKKKIEEYLQKKIRNKKTYQKAVFPENIEKDAIVKNTVSKLDELKMINENDYLESMFHYYQKSYFSIRKIKNKLRQKGFEQKTIDDFILNQLQEDPDFEVKILKKYIQKKKIGSLEVSQLKKKLYQQSFNENSIYKIINE